MASLSDFEDKITERYLRWIERGAVNGPVKVSIITGTEKPELVTLLGSTGDEIVTTDPLTMREMILDGLPVGGHSVRLEPDKTIVTTEYFLGMTEGEK